MKTSPSSSRRRHACAAAWLCRVAWRASAGGRRSRLFAGLASTRKALHLRPHSLHLQEIIELSCCLVDTATCKLVPAATFQASAGLGAAWSASRRAACAGPAAAACATPPTAPLLRQPRHAALRQAHGAPTADRLLPQPDGHHTAAVRAWLLCLGCCAACRLLLHPAIQLPPPCLPHACSQGGRRAAAARGAGAAAGLAARAGPDRAGALAAATWAGHAQVLGAAAPAGFTGLPLPPPPAGQDLCARDVEGLGLESDGAQGRAARWRGRRLHWRLPAGCCSWRRLLQGSSPSPHSLFPADACRCTWRRSGARLSW